MKLTDTQERVLHVLKARKKAGEKLLPTIEARAIGGLTPVERDVIIGCFADGSWVCGEKIKGARIETLHALHSKGLVRCTHGVWVAI